MDNKVFICYSRADKDFVFKLAMNLKSRGVPLWLDQWDIPFGGNWTRKIDNALKESTRLLLVLSPDSVESDEVRCEWLSAVNAKKIIVPILYKKCNIPYRLTAFQYIDFTTLGPDNERAIGEILSALRLNKKDVGTINAIYIVPDKAYKVFKDQIALGVEGLCITRLDPMDVRLMLGFKETPVIKLSNEEGDGECISPSNLLLLLITIRSFVESRKNSIVLIDNIEYLINRNAGIVPEEDMLDFICEIEILSKSTRILLAERREFIQKDMPSDVNEIGKLLFSLKSIPAYLFKIFSEAMLSGLKEQVINHVVNEVNMLITSGAFFEEAKVAPQDESPAVCEPNMREKSSYGGPGIKESSSLVLTHRGFLVATNRLASIIKKYDQSFDFIATVGDLMKSYGRSPYEAALIPGTCYAILRDNPDDSFQLFADLINHDINGLCVSRYNPDMLNKRYNIPIENIIWLTMMQNESELQTLDPTNLPGLISRISRFLENSNNPIILLEGISYLITHNHFEYVLSYIYSQRDEIAFEQATMIISIDPLSLGIAEYHRLISVLEPLDLKFF